MSNGNLSFIEELGIGEPNQEVTETSEETNEPSITETVEAQDESIDSEEQTSEPQTDDTQEDTEPNELVELKKQMEVMQKRIDDKDNYIQELREQSKQKEAEVDSKEEGVDEEEDFWEDPVGKYKSLQEQIKIQQMLIAETQYANNVNDYWKTVNQDALKEAVATDTEFAQKFNSSSEPYRIAYEYLSAKKETKIKSETALKEQIRKEILAEMNVKPKKETVPSTANISGKSESTSNRLDEDGFASVFGR